MAHNCIKCGKLLVVGENTTTWQLEHSCYTCRSCKCDYHRKRCHRIGYQQPMDKDKTCTLFLGVHVAERVLSHVFKDVKRMPLHNHGYDFICSQGYKCEVKSGCRDHFITQSDRWKFRVKKNQIADYFLFLAFDNRKDLNPEHIWLIPTGEINDHEMISISESRIHKWDKYALDINKVSTCCNTLKGVK